ncbi:MAG TPA: permease-like cell division protein FtsX [Chitinophagaceae bacterium]
MGQSGKASIKRGKPSYFMSILGVTLVLFLLGIIGWLVINANKLGSHFKESVEVSVYLTGDLNPKDSIALVNYIASKPYVRGYTYVNKAMAKQKFMADNDNEDWDKILTENPLPPSIDFTLKKEYVNVDTLKTIEADLEQQTYVDEVKYQQALVDKLTSNIRRISAILLGIAIILAIVVIILIDNTIRLAMFSNRFLIKTMQMVGATRWFIAKPMNVRAIINGAVSGAIAVAAVWLLVLVAERYVPEMKSIHDNNSMMLLFLGLIVLGVCITLFSTHRSVVKYLKMKLDELY